MMILEDVVIPVVKALCRSYFDIPMRIDLCVGLSESSLAVLEMGILYHRYT
jgi:hypothetical protein